MIRLLLVFPLFLLLLAGCGGVKHYLHRDFHEQLRTGLEPVSLTVGEEVLAIRDTRGLTSIAGGYFPTLIAEDPDLVDIRYAWEGNTARTYLTGKTPGTTVLYYVNSAVFGDPTMGIDEYGEEGAYYRETSPRFELTVSP